MAFAAQITNFLRILIVTTIVLAGSQAGAINNTFSPALSDASVKNFLERPDQATAAKYDAKDNVGNAMYSPSIIQLTAQPYKYAAVYHTPNCVTFGTDGKCTGYRYKLNIAGSNDLITWNFVGLLVDNADMPKIAQVSGSSWIMIVHEQWTGPGSTSTGPAKLGYKLFYDANDLMSLTIRSSWLGASFSGSLNGTPSIYECHLALYQGYYGVDGQFGFHFWNGSRDVNAVQTTLRLFNPLNQSINYPSVATNYNNSLIALGVTGNIGQRDTLVTASARFNVQEVNLGQPGVSFEKWRVWLYKFGDANFYPTGNGTWTTLSPKTPGNSTSFGNPSISVVDRPTGSGKALVISYTIFSEGAALGEAGPLIFYYNI